MPSIAKSVRRDNQLWILAFGTLIVILACIFRIKFRMVFDKPGNPSSHQWLLSQVILVHDDDTRCLLDLGYGYAPFYIEILPQSRHSL